MPSASVLILLVAWAALAAADRSPSLRERLLRGAVGWGAAVVLLTEGLGLAGLLRPGPVFAAWCAVTVAAVGVAVARKTPPPSLRPPRPSWSDAAALLAIGVVFGCTGLTAWVSAPNSADAMAYHLPRVLYWMQQGSVDFFPTHYLNQVSLQPFAEYVTLHTFLLSDGDGCANLPQYGAFLLCVVGVSVVARELGAGRSGQILAAFFAATLPNATLQASGAKNDLVLAAWLVAFLALGLASSRSGARAGWVPAAFAGALALFTKGTAYLFLPPLALALVGMRSRQDRWAFAGRLAVGGIAATLLLNGPLFLRNFELSGSPLGFDSSQADGRYRWQNEAPGVRTTLSNLLRHASEQLGARSPAWNEGVYQAVLTAHAWLGADPNDPRSTWREAAYQAPRNANHEADANNRWHLLAYALSAAFLLGRPRAKGRRELLLLGGAVLLGLLGFCAYLKWQPFQARMLTPLFILAAPIPALLLESVPAVARLLVTLLLLSNVRLALTANWTRPLEGPHSILRIERSEGYFADLTPWGNRESYLASVDILADSGCDDVGLDLTEYQIEYPFQALLRLRRPEVRFRHVQVRNPSARFERPGMPPPCAVVCMNCADVPETRVLYTDYPVARTAGRFLVFLR
ncbi:MAG: hypothetical protein GC160_06275 [Acidobacteria bacterium]|nr:hypothetical protein [Acidobacteriota bacterium]